MTQNPPEGYPRISPYLIYEDGGSALDWLTRAFGFDERMRMADPESGRIMHSEIELDGAVVMLASTSQGDFKSPADLGAPPTSFVYVYVDDVDAHFAHAKEAGAEILSEPETQSYGDRHYGVKDPDGHMWYFSQHVEDVVRASPSA
jgi:uncharacterized glyoxalase superfamily protein PhnB